MVKMDLLKRNLEQSLGWALAASRDGSELVLGVGRKPMEADEDEAVSLHYDAGEVDADELACLIDAVVEQLLNDGVENDLLPLPDVQGVFPLVEDGELTDEG